MKDYINYISQKNIFTSKLAFARTLFALGSLGTLIFTDIGLVMNTDILDLGRVIPVGNLLFRDISIFEIFNVTTGKCIAILILLFVLTGYLPQLSIFLQTWVHVSICNSVIELDGGDQIAANICLLLIPICVFDNRLNQWRENLNLKKRELINVYCNTFYFLILLQVSVIYFHAGVGKIAIEEWLSGTCLYFWTTNNIYGAPDFLQSIYNFFTLSKIAPILTWLVIFLEIGLFACLFASNVKLKRLFLFLGIAFHFMIFITHGLASFFFSTSGALILYLDDENYIFKKLQNFILIISNKFKKQNSNGLF